MQQSRSAQVVFQEFAALGRPSNHALTNETEQTSKREADVERACSCYSSHCKPEGKLHLLVGSLTWAHLTAETPRGENNRVKGGENGGVLTLLASFSCTSWLQQTQAALAPSQFPAFHELSPQQGAGTALPRASRYLQHFWTSARSTRTKGNQIKLFAEATEQQELNNLVNLYHHKRETIQILRILYQQCLV